MDTIKITPSRLGGSITVPPSKSHTLRALLFGSLGEGKTKIHHYLKSPDTVAMITALSAFGAEILEKEDTLEIVGLNGQLKKCENVIDAGNSGLVLRLIGGLAALCPTYTILTGDHSIRHRRPMEPFLSALAQLKAFAVSSRLDGMAPIIVRGPLKAGSATLAGEDSQPVSALLIACSFLEGTTQLMVTNPGEKPWIDLTLSWLKQLGGKISHQNHTHYTITGSLRFKGFETRIPSDFSSLAFPLVAALITRSKLTLENIDMGDVQGDKKIIEILKRMGAGFEINVQKKTLTVCPHSSLVGRTIDANEMIDALPILAVAGCFAAGKTEICNALIARKKESDRIHAIALELRKMGAQIEERKDGLLITPSKLSGAKVTSHKDHRIAMALSVAALAAEGDSVIEDTACIAKTYPSFVADFQKIGGLVA